MIPVFVDGVPLRITIHDFRKHHGEHFPDLLDASKDGFLESVIEDTYTMWHGINTLWNLLDEQQYFDKTRLCFRLLTCWYIADQYPKYVRGIPSMGGMDLRRKKIGSVDITFGDNGVNDLDSLSYLKSNPFGRKALAMIKNNIKRRFLRSQNFIY